MPPAADQPAGRARTARLALVLLAVALGTWQRARAVALLPADFDELPCLHAAFRHAERMTPGRWKGRGGARSWPGPSSTPR